MKKVKERFITRTVICSKVDILFYNEQTQTTESRTTTICGDYTDDEVVILAKEEYTDCPMLLPIKVVIKDKYTALYKMKESDFCTFGTLEKINE